MKMEFKKKVALTFAAIGLSILSHAQTGIGTFNPDKSARLDIYSDKTGFLMPRVALVRTTQQNPITAPATSLMVYNTATNNDVTPGYYYWDGQRWTRIAKSDEFTFNNGLTATNGNVQLGGTLTQPSTLTTTATSTLSIKGLQTGTAADNILVADANGVLKAVTRTSLGGNDNLGNHMATQDLNMSAKNIMNINNATIKNDLLLSDRVVANTNYFSIYKNAGNFGIWNSLNNTNSVTIDETTNKTTIFSAQITKGVNGLTPQSGYVATSSDANGNIIWTKPQDFGNIIYKSAVIAPGSSYVVNLQADPEYSNFMITSTNGCLIPMILNIAGYGDGLSFVGGAAGGSTYIPTQLDGYSKIFKFTATTVGCQDGGNSTEFNVTIKKEPGKLTITNNGNAPRIYQVRQKLN